MLKHVVVGGLAAFLLGCSSTVPLNDVPVSDASSTSVTGAAAANDGANGAGVSKSGVAGVELGKVPTELASGPGRVIYFDFDSYVIRPEFQPLLAKHAKFLRENTGRKAAIEGHTDEVGGREYNLALGQKRGDAVRDALAILGVSRAQMEAVSFGMEKPAVQGADETSAAKNRRAEIRYE